MNGINHGEIELRMN